MQNSADESEKPETSEERVQMGAVRLLLVDAARETNHAFTQALREEGYDVYSLSAAQEAVELLTRLDADLVLIDLNLPDMDGFELLERLHAFAPNLPIITLTDRADVDTARRVLNIGACDFIAKPCLSEEIPVIVERNLPQQALARRHNQRQQRELQHSYESMLDALLSVLDARDPETEGHAERVTAYAIEIACALGLSQEEMYHIERGALLHDIGKLGIPDKILLKPGPLNEAEWEEMRQHPAMGFRMCAGIDLLKDAAQIVLRHHERWDGKGYPDGLKGEEIPIGARIFAIVDAFDAMTTDRPYRKAISYRDAVSEIIRNCETQFDPRVVQAFLSVSESRWEKIRRSLSAEG